MAEVGPSKGNLPTDDPATLDAGCDAALDPRIRRTRELLQQALTKLLIHKEFEKISVQDITDEATVNRATFYAHYPDKFALLECIVAGQFQRLLTERGVRFDEGCTSAVRGMVLSVCDYLAQATGPEGQVALEPHLEKAVLAVVRKMMLEGTRKSPASGVLSAGMRAAAASWAIYGAAREWAHTPNRQPSEPVAEAVLQLVLPMLHGG